jgi:PKD repeat protein
MIRKSAMILLIAILSLTLAMPVLAAPLSSATSVAGGNISGTWNAAGSPYLIQGNITIPSGSTLTIEPGVQVLFQSWYSLTVNGTLIADGSASAPVLFSANNSSPGWLGIRFINASNDSSLTYAIVEKGHASGADPLNSGGGIYIDGSSPTISHSTIRNNSATYSGGGIYLNNSNATLTANTIINNGTFSNGGGLAIWYSNPVLTDNIISGNTITISGGYTTPNGYGAGLFLRSSDATFTGNLISDNHVNASLNSNSRGAGLYLYYGSPNFINNTITGNTIENESTGYYAVKEGGAIYSYYANPTFVNTILWNDMPQEIFVANYGYPNSTLTFAYSDLQGGQAGIANNNLATINWEQGNVNKDPRFVDSASADFSLQSNSQLIDAGTAYFAWNGTTLIDLSSSEYNGSAPDIGAFESSYSGSGGSNQPPVAVASANPNAGTAPLTVQFSSNGSYDPDGIITSYAWDFGDGNISSAANPSHTYTASGAYEAVLVVTDDHGAAGNASVTINVVQASQNELHVQSQNVTRQQLTKRIVRGVDTLLITDQNNQPVAGVTVTVSYSGPNSGQTSGVTNANGMLILYTAQQRNPKGNWCFDVTNVAKNNYTYNPNANVVTLQCE